MGNEESKNNESSTSHFLFNQPGKKSHCSATINMPMIAKKICTTCQDMPPSAFLVLFGVFNFLKPSNALNVRMKELAKFCGVSLGSVQRAMKYFEDHNLMVRRSMPNEYADWMLNQEWIWNNRHDQHAQAVGFYKKLQYDASQRSYRKKRKGDDSKEIHHEIQDESVSYATTSEEEQTVCQEKAA